VDLNLLIGNWERTGLLEGGLTDRQKAIMSIKFENLALHLLNLSDKTDYMAKYGKIEIIIFPLLRRICLEKDEITNTYTMYGSVNPLRVLDDVTAWWNSSEICQSIDDMSAHTGIDVEAELVAVYAESQGHKYRYDSHYKEEMGIITPTKFVKRHKL
jgi:hypothetical protein